MSKSSWDLINSWWLVLPFTIYLNWLAFLYIGITARHRRWMLYGLIYAIPIISVQIIANMTNVNHKVVSATSLLGISTTIMFLMGIISIIYAFTLREEYLIRLKALKYSNKNDDKLRKKIAREYGLSERIFSDSQDSTKIKDEGQTVSDDFVNDFSSGSVSRRVDINNDSEDLLAELPGVSVILAKKAIELRQSGVYFDSAEDFGEALDLKPHTIEGIKHFIVITPSRDEKKIMKNKGRIVDI